MIPTKSILTLTLRTEIEALSLLAGVHAEIVAAGGVRGAEGAVWLGVWGSNDAVEKASVLIESVASEPQFQF